MSNGLESFMQESSRSLNAVPWSALRTRDQTTYSPLTSLRDRRACATKLVPNTRRLGGDSPQGLAHGLAIIGLALESANISVIGVEWSDFLMWNAQFRGRFFDDLRYGKLGKLLLAWRGNPYIARTLCDSKVWVSKKGTMAMPSKQFLTPSARASSGVASYFSCFKRSFLTNSDCSPAVDTLEQMSMMLATIVPQACDLTSPVRGSQEGGANDGLEKRAVQNLVLLGKNEGLLVDND